MRLDPLSQKLFAAGAGFYLAVILLCLNVPFFWDTILTSSVAQWFYDNGIQNAIAPLKWDAGHPTLFQIYLMFCWKIFGKTLAVSHIAMLPFLWLMVFAFVYICQKITTFSIARIVGLLFLLLHPYILTQSTMMSYDIIQIAFFLTAIIGIIEKRNFWLLMGIWGLSACSIRGQMIGIVCLGSYLITDFRNWRNNIILLTAACIPLLLWHFYHYDQTGWMISTPSDSWKTHRDVASIQQLLSNVIGITRGFVDYGLLPLSILFLCAVTTIRAKPLSGNIRKILFTTTLIFIVLNTSMLLFSNPIGHRYFMIIHVGMIFLIISQWKQIAFSKFWVAITLAAFISGHFWLYPIQLSNGWDVTLQYLSYEKSRKDFFRYISEYDIPPGEIASAFPLFCSQQQTDLTSGERLKDISEFSIRDYSYIAYSPVCNDMRDYPVENQPVIKIFGKRKTKIVLYKNQVLTVFPGTE